MDIGNRTVSPSSPYIIGEVALAHDGSLSLAHSYIEAIAETGAHAVKFQMHMHRPGARWRVTPRWPQDEDRNAYWKRTGFDAYQWLALKSHALEFELDFLVSPFSLQAFKDIRDLGVPAWKVPSGEIANHELLESIVGTGTPAILSTGMATLEEVGDAAEHFSLDGLVLLQCSSLYPTPPQRVGVNVMRELREFGCHVGMSDHSGTIYPSLIALHEGASVIEVHVVLDRRMHGFDCSSSVTPAELKQIVKGARFIPRMDAVDKNDTGPYEDARRVFM